MWKWMHSRCYNEGDPMYPLYGGRGIYVDERWHIPEEYISWALRNGWKKGAGLQIDRIDNDGPYSPENCRVTTRVVNANNKSKTVRHTAFGETKTLAEWQRDSRCAVSYATLWARVHQAGVSLETALTNAPRHGGGPRPV